MPVALFLLLFGLSSSPFVGINLFTAVRMWSSKKVRIKSSQFIGKSKARKGEILKINT